MDQNRGSYQALVAQCEALGITVALDGEVRTALSGDRFPQDTGLELDAMVDFEKFKLNRDDACTVPSPANGWGAGKNCIAGSMALYVSPEGDLMPCVTWPEALGNLAKGDRLADLWHGAPRLRQIKAHTRDDREACRTCPVRQDCEFCMGQAFVETGDPYSGITTLCLTTRAKTLARARALGQPDPPLPAGLARLAEDDATPKAPSFRILNAAQVAAMARTGS
jgi:radical SAM protein with 4Fe4S-binding SPASM domain